MYSNNSIRVPAPFDEVLERPRQIDPNRPPFIPRLQVTEEMDRFIPYLAARLMMTVQAEVEGGARQGNEARTIFYNTLSYNGWRNKGLEDACAFAADYVEAIVFRQQLFDRIPQVIDGEIDNIVEMLVAMLIKRYPDIETFYPPEVLGDITMGQRRYHDALDMIHDHRRRLHEGAQQSRYDDRNGYDRGGSYGRPDDRYASKYPPSMRDGGRGSYGGGSYGGRDDYRGGRGPSSYQPSNLYTNDRQQRNHPYGQQRQQGGRPMPHNPYAKMLAKRAQKWEEEHADDRRPVAAHQPTQPQREQQSRGGYREDTPQRASVGRPNLRRDASYQPEREERSSDLMPWEDGYEQQEQKITAQQTRDRKRDARRTAVETEQPVYQDTGAPMTGINLQIVSNPTDYEVDPSLNGDAACYTIEYNSPFTWKPSPKQWHKPSYKPAEELRLVKLLPDDTVVYEIFDKENPLPQLTFFKGQETVDFMKHIAPHSALKRTGFVNSAEYEERHEKVLLDGLIKQANTQREMRRENRVANETDAPEVYSAEDLEKAMSCIEVAAVHTVDTSDLGMVTTVDLNKRRAQKNHELPILAYRNYALKIETRVAEDTINNPEYDDISIHLDMLRDTTTYREVAYVLEKMRKDPGADPVFTQMANERIVRAVNRQLRFNLSISGLSVEGLFDVRTVEEVENILKEQYGEYVFKKFSEHQEGIIRQIFIQEGQDTVKKFDEYYDTDGLENIKLHHMVTRHSITLIDLRLSELMRDLDPDTGSVVDASSGLTWIILNNLIDKGNRVANESKLNVYRNLIRLSDGTLLELHKGHLAPNTLILAYAEPF